MQLLVAFNQPQMFVQAFQLHIGWGKAVKAHIAIHRTYDRVHGLFTVHAPEIKQVITQLKFVIDNDFQYRAHRPIKQPAFHGIVIELDKRFDPLKGIFVLFQSQVNQQL